MLPSDAVRLAALLGDWTAAGRSQALRALTREGMWKASLVPTLVALLGDRNAEFAREVADALEARPSAAALEALILSLPTERLPARPPAAEAAKVKILKAWLDASAWPGKAPDLDVDGVKWQRWWRENKDRVRLK